MPAFDIADCINETCPWSGKAGAARLAHRVRRRSCRVLQYRLPRQVRARNPSFRRGEGVEGAQHFLTMHGAGSPAPDGPSGGSRAPFPRLPDKADLRGPPACDEPHPSRHRPRRRSPSTRRVRGCPTSRPRSTRRSAAPGFCYIAGTGIDPALVEAVFDASRRFHALPASAKEAIAINEFHRGYIAPKSSLIRTSSVARVTQPNLSESFMAMHEVDPDDEAYGRPLQGPNQWPANLPGFREAVTRLPGCDEARSHAGSTGCSPSLSACRPSSSTRTSSARPPGSA